MKVTVMHVALTALGLAASSFAAPAVDGDSKQVDIHLEPACVDLWQDGAHPTLLQSNYCFPQNKCISRQQYNNGAPEHVGLGAMDFKGTCCQLFAFDDCNESTGSDDYFLTCDPGVIPPKWRSKVNSILCYLPGQLDLGWRHKRDEVKVAGVVPPLRFRYTVFEGHTLRAPLTKREQSVTSTVTLELPTVSTAVSGVSYIKPTYPIFNITISNTVRPDDLPVATLTGHLPIVKCDHKVSDIAELGLPTAFKTLTSVSYSKSTDTIFNITITNEGRPNGPQH
ncbi:hypothetical protein E6O75_ATG01706 [Venturia nashicola]|uniref:Uncharacterized protein n=1 Tax=Venturia nashicola TaxID=86259 RepID=A0A4Z1P1Z8_9PEZI|nr:hypothetical protein E6O75_ATG01706 [Venturia nashicola]